MNVGSLFSGIGGFDLGFERAGMRTVWFCESEPFCQRVLARHWPGVPCYPDVAALRGEDVESVDVLCGGFPCQDLSLAGKGAGIDGARSGLWGEFARLIGELRPRYVVVENVPALLGRGAGRVLGDLAQVGYDAEWDCLPAAAFGAPHQRDRVWLVAYPAGEQHEGRPPQNGRPPAADLPADTDGRGRGARLAHLHARQPDAEGSSAVPDPVGCLVDECGRASSSGDEGQGPLADPDEERRDGGAGQLGPGRWGELADSCEDPDSRTLQPWRVGGRAAQASGSEWWAIEPPVGRVAHGVPDRLDQLAALGNSLVPQIAEWIGRRILSYEDGRVA